MFFPWTPQSPDNVLSSFGMLLEFLVFLSNFWVRQTWFEKHLMLIWRLYTWTLPDGQHRNQTDDVLCSQRWRSSIQSTKTRPGADCGSDHQPLIAKFRLNLKKVGKSTRPFRYDLNAHSPTTNFIKLYHMVNSFHFKK